MTHSRRSTLAVSLALALGVLAFPSRAPNAFSQESKSTLAAGSKPAVIRATMRGIFTSLTEAYSYSLDIGYFQDRHNRDGVLAALEALVANTAALEAHGGGLDPSFGYLRRYLANDAAEALKRYNERQYLGSQFMLKKLMENCATCHSRLPADQAFDTGAEFLKEARVEAVAPVDRVDIEIAARQFEAALDTYEHIFALGNMTAEGLELIGAFEGYLKITLGVKNDSARPVQVFTAFLKRDDMPEELQGQVRAWIDDLRTLDMNEMSRRPLASARLLAGDATVVRRAPSVRPELVRMVASNALLHRHVRSMPADAPETSEVYYLLAVTDSRISRSFWIAETDYLLEQAVRSSPRSAYAQRAFAVLEDRASSPAAAGAYEGWTPAKIDIDELRRLIEG
jgi:hypothetical protein